MEICFYRGRRGGGFPGIWDLAFPGLEELGECVSEMGWVALRFGSALFCVSWGGSGVVRDFWRLALGVVEINQPWVCGVDLGWGGGVGGALIDSLGRDRLLHISGACTRKLS